MHQAAATGPVGQDLAIVTASGVNGQVSVYRTTVLIKRKGSLAFLTQGLKGEKTIQIRQISSIQFKQPGTFTNGYIQFAFHGGLETKGGIFDAVSDENTVMFSAAQEPAFRQVKAAVEELLEAAVPSAPHVAASSAADELEKLASLCERGFITPEEFNQKKRQLLDM